MSVLFSEPRAQRGISLPRSRLSLGHALAAERRTVAGSSLWNAQSMGRRSSTVWRAIDHLHRLPDARVVLCIDVEPDPQRFDPANPPAWLGFERIVQRLPALRRRLSEATGTRAMFTWCLRMDP